ncbi:MAG: hypothetical protein V4525_09895 [Pseudomonadota bacterium]
MNSDIHSQIQQVHKDNLSVLLREASVAQACQYFGCDKVRLISHPTTHSLGQVVKTHIVISLLSCSELRIVIKVHFNPGQLRRYRQAKESDDIAITDRQLIDYIKEFCNQLGGKICRAFDAHQIFMGMSIPLCTRGIYEIYADYSPKDSYMTKFGVFWGLEGPFETLYCSCYVETLSQTCLSNIQYIGEESQEGELDFL